MEDIKYWVESSFVFEDTDKEFPETLVVVSDLGDEIGTETIGTFPIDVKVELEDLIRAINKQIKSV
jgi:hypothetical protein